MSAVILTLWSLVVIGTAPDKPVVTGIATHDFADMVVCEQVAREMAKRAGVVRAKCFPK